MIKTKNPAATFWHISKTGGTSIGVWFEENNIKHTRQKGGKHVTPTKKKDDRVYWGVVRNPYDRFASYYRYMSEKQSQSKKKKNPPILQKFPTFEDFCLDKNHETAPIKNLTPQWKYAKSFDIIIRLEHIKKDFKQIQKLYDCWEPLPRVNTSVESDIDTTYTPEMREAVYQLYEMDFENLGYKK